MVTWKIADMLGLADRGRLRRASARMSCVSAISPAPLSSVDCGQPAIGRCDANIRLRGQRYQLLPSGIDRAIIGNNDRFGRVNLRGFALQASEDRLGVLAAASRESFGEHLRRRGDVGDNQPPTSARAASIDPRDVLAMTTWPVATAASACRNAVAKPVRLPVQRKRPGGNRRLEFLRRHRRVILERDVPNPRHHAADEQEPRVAGERRPGIAISVSLPAPDGPTTRTRAPGPSPCRAPSWLAPSRFCSRCFHRSPSPFGLQSNRHQRQLDDWFRRRCSASRSIGRSRPPQFPEITLNGNQARSFAAHPSDRRCPRQQTGALHRSRRTHVVRRLDPR